MGAPITIDIPHQLGAVEARRRIDRGFAKLAEGIARPGLVQLTRSWQGDEMVFASGILGQAIRGRVLVMEYAVRMEVELPAFLASIGQVIRTRIQREGQALLEKR